MTIDFSSSSNCSDFWSSSPMSAALTEWTRIQQRLWSGRRSIIQRAHYLSVSSNFWTNHTNYWERQWNYLKKPEPGFLSLLLSTAFLHPFKLAFA
jgi:hypothetical protein